MSFGVTKEDVGSYANGLVFTTTSTPSTAQIDTYIAQATQSIRARLNGYGVSPDSITLAGHPDTYAVCARLVTLDSAAWAIAARGRDVTGLSSQLNARYDSELQTLHMQRQYLGSGRNVGDSAPTLARGPQSSSSIAANGVTTTAGAGFFRDSGGQL